MAEERDWYRESGVDIDAGNEAVRRIAAHVRSASRPEVIGGFGGFGAGFLLQADRYREPVLVSGADGVGTKLKVAFALGRHETVGTDAVAMCVNDILAMGADPLFFLDYFACGRLDPAVAEAVVSGIADGCRTAGAALVGGETAEMPGMYADGEYDLAGFAVGVVERDEVVDGRRAEPGDALIGVGSSGLHSNGFSLVRRLLAEAGVSLSDVFRGEDASVGDRRTVGEELLTPTRIYVRAVQALRKAADVRAMAHITGGGLLENVPRAFPDGLGADIDPDTWPVPPVFPYLRSLADIDERTLYRTWNMGIGFVAAVPAVQAEAALAALWGAGERAYRIGRVEPGRGVRLLRGWMSRGSGL